MVNIEAMAFSELTELQSKQVNWIHLRELEGLSPEKSVELFVPTDQFSLTGEIPGAYQDRKRIIWGFYDEGAYRSGIPVIEQLQQEVVDTFILAGGAAKRALEGRSEDLGFRKMNFSPRTDLEALTANLVVSGSDPTKHLEQVLVAHGLKQGMITVKYEDNSPFMAFYDQELARMGLLVIPNFAFFASKTSATQSVNFIPAYKGREVVVGNPADDRFFYEDTEGNYQRIREELGILPHEWFITYAATKTTATYLTAEDLVTAARSLLESFKLTLRVHPNEYNDPVIGAKYRLLLVTLGDHGVDTMMRNNNGKLHYSMDEIRHASDIVVTDTSTTGMDAVFDNGLRLGKGPKLVIHARIPENMSQRPEWKEAFPPEPAVIADGSSAVVRRKENFGPVLNSIMRYESVRRRMWTASEVWKRQNDGRSTERFTEKVLEIVGV